MGASGNILFGKRCILFHKGTPCHNLWLTIAATLGIVGLLIYLYMKHYLYESIILLLKNKCSLAPLLAGIQAVIIGHGLVDFTIMAPQGGIIFIICSAIISALSIQYNAARTNEGYFLPLPDNIKEFQCK